MEKGLVDIRGTVVRRATRGVQWDLAIQFVDLAGKDQDRLRRRVFQALREERTRTVE